jgi:hypothetical protein
VPAEVDDESRARALSALAAGESVSAAARAANYSRRHLQRLQADPDFALALAARRSELAASRVAAGGPGESELSRLERGALEHLERLAAGQADGDPKMAGARVAAASTILRHVIAVRGRAPRAGQMTVRAEAGANGARAFEASVSGAPALLDQVAELMRRL